MRLLTVVTAALAAGSISFAAIAAPVSQRSVSDGATTVQRTPLFPSTKAGEEAKKSDRKRVKGASGRVAAKPEKKAERGNKKRRNGQGRQRIIIDTTTTASIPDRGYAAPSGKAFSKYDLYVSRHAASNGVPVSLAHAVIRVESNYRADARGSAGEVGLMQIKPATARMMGYRGSVKGLFDPETNIKYGMKYLGMAHKLGGGATCQTILKYNAGHAARRMNPVSSAYCGKVKRSLAGL